jgi:hypothetical protein
MSASSESITTRKLLGVAAWKWAALGLAAALLAIAFAASGSSTKEVAKVGGKSISLSTFQHWMVASAQSAHASNSSIPPFVPDAPSYARCIAYERGTQAGKTASVAQLRSACQALHVSFAESVMELLISGQWILDQGAQENVTVSPAKIQSSLHASFPQSTGLAHFLNSNGLDRSDLEYEAQVDLMAQGLNGRHAGTPPTVTAAQIASYYNTNRSQMGGETLAQATPAIHQALIAQGEAPAIERYLTSVQRHWQPQTTCVSGYRIAYYCASHS